MAKKQQSMVNVVKAVGVKKAQKDEPRTLKERRAAVTVHFPTLREDGTGIVSYRYNNVKIAAFEIKLPSNIKVVDGSISRDEREALKHAYYNVIQKGGINIDKELLNWYQIRKQIAQQ